MNEEIMDKLLNDPSVIALVKKAGNDALSEPKVQEEIMKKCKDFGASHVSMDMLVDFAQDPEVQEKAYKNAGFATVCVGDAKGELVRKLEQGPVGLRFLAFFGGAASFGFGIFNCVNVFGILSHTVKYVLDVYIVLFSLTGVVFEAEADWVKKIPWILDYQDTLIDHAKFLSQMFGRGLFYIFLGTLWLSNMDTTWVSVTGWCATGLGCYMLFIGFLHALMSYDILASKKLVERVRELKHRYKQVPSTSEQ